MIKQLLIAIDQLFNALLFGWADETLSARAWRLSAKSDAMRMIRIFIDALFFFDRNHCRNSYLSEIERKHLPAEYRHGPGNTKNRDSNGPA